MDIKEYVESFGWKIEDLTPYEMREAKKELHAINNGMMILDGVLTWKGLMSD